MTAPARPTVRLSAALPIALVSIEKATRKPWVDRYTVEYNDPSGRPQTAVLEHGEFGLDDTARLAARHRNIVHPCPQCRLRGQQQVAVMSVPSLERRATVGMHTEFAGHVLADPLAADHAILEFLDPDEIGLQSMQHLADPLRRELAVAADTGMHVVAHQAYTPACGPVAIASGGHRFSRGAAAVSCATRASR